MLRSRPLRPTRDRGKRPVFTHRNIQAHVIPLLLSLFLLCSTGMAWVLPAIAADFSNGPPHGPTLSVMVETEDAAQFATPPQSARDLLKLLRDRDGAPLPGYIGGRDFQNRERRLPRGRYREYDVNPKVRGRTRDAERIVIEQRTGKAYYTGDHYRTFVPLN
jgi:ribonuclease T1